MLNFGINFNQVGGPKIADIPIPPPPTPSPRTATVLGIVTCLLPTNVCLTDRSLPCIVCCVSHCLNSFRQDDGIGPSCGSHQLTITNVRMLDWVCVTKFSGWSVGLKSVKVQLSTNRQTRYDWLWPPANGPLSRRSWVEERLTNPRSVSLGSRLVTYQKMWSYFAVLSRYDLQVTRNR